MNHQDCTLVCSQEDNKRQEAAVKAVAAAAGVLADPPFPYHSIRDRSKEELVVVRRFELPHKSSHRFLEPWCYSDQSCLVALEST